MSRKNNGKSKKEGRGSSVQWYNYDIPEISTFLEIHLKHEGLPATLKGIDRFKELHSSIKGESK